MNFQRSLDVLFLPDDVMVKLLWKEFEIDMMPDELNERHFINSFILFKIQSQFAAVQFKLAPLEVSLEVPSKQINFKLFLKLLEDVVLDLFQNFDQFAYR